MAAVAGSAGKRRVLHRHLIEFFRLGNVVLFHVLGHGVHDSSDLLFRFGVVIELESWTPVRPDVIWIGGMAGVAMRAERAGPSFHDVVDLVPGQILRQNLEIGWGREAARRSAWCSGWRALRCLGNGRDRENCAGYNGNRDRGRGQGSDFQADSSRREMTCFQMDGILINKDATAN